MTEGWYEWKYMCNLDATGDSAYAIDLADLMVMVEEAPWLWCACWLDLEEMQMQQMLVLSGVEGMASGEGTLQAWSVSDMMTESTAPTVIPNPAEPGEESIEQQISQLQEALVLLVRIWLDEPEIRLEVDTEAWQEFMLSVYQELLDLQTQSVQLE